MTSGTDSPRTQSHSLTPVARLLSLCRRHDLSLALLAVQIKNLSALGRELGSERLRKLQQQLAQALHQHTRMEDAVVSWQRGYLLLCLPGTRADGAAALARRLTDWFATTRFSLDSRALTLQTAMAVHVADHQGGEYEGQVRELLMETLCLLATSDDETSEPVLSRRALRQGSDGDSDPQTSAGGDRRRPPAGTGSQRLQALINELGDDGAILIRALSPALQRLDESTRLTLVDHLLEASLRP
ncbi:diguanylate cyclase domain-containing protein [Alloalcanivorax mobilis]|uniref:diguanylate cyclase domain-containing protein n=1 Tax=Alloalcanivorax mobilis TaxID=2019569 RepID=UPI000B5B43C6|nr:diguanylate cyclase [Alloalcanivorax mobilis]ASK34203.1 hypothetical protein CEK62_07305 [Alcanivorax sp. N3-2A]|tara:strand:- start:11790 stop:12518 length:729 start_codon:yes stop_codon:yes gene_type:complete